MLFLLFLCLYHCDERRNCIYEHLWIYVDILSVLNRIKSGVSEVKTGKAKQSNCVCEKPQTDFAGNTGCPLLKSPANGSRFSCNSMSKSLDEQAFYMLYYTLLS